MSEEAFSIPTRGTGKAYQPQVRFLEPNEHPLWSEFIQASPQSTIFSVPEFCEAYARVSPYSFRIAGIFLEDRLQGGLVFFEKEVEGKRSIPGVLEYVPYQTIHFAPDRKRLPLKRVDESIAYTEALTKHLETEYDPIRMGLHPSIHDIRPFQWYRYHEGGFYTIEVRYTSIVPIDSEAEMWERLHPHARRNIRRGEKNHVLISESVDFDVFARLYIATFRRQGIVVDAWRLQLIRELFRTLEPLGMAKLCFAHTTHGDPLATILYTNFNDQLYYSFAAHDPDQGHLQGGAVLMWKSMVASIGKFSQLDFLGINSPNRGWYKLSFGGSITPYFVVSGPNRTCPS